MSEFLNLTDNIYQGVGQYGIPQIDGEQEINVKDWIGFNYVNSFKGNTEETGVNFFLTDQMFERVWYQPNRYAEVLKKFGCVLSPDFSLYTDFPKAVQIFNHYRKHWLAKYWQDNGIKVIPTIAWSDKESFNWCFDGEPKESIVAVSNVGCMKNKETRKLFMDGYNEMLTRLQPSKILLFAHKMDDYKGNIEVVKYNYFRGDK